MIFTSALVCANIFTIVGCPVPSTGASRKETSRPFPCQDRPCGCLTYDACWAGDCCCFTLGQKLDWAVRKGLEAPASAKACALPESTVEKSCCATPKAPAKWVSAAFISACRGEHSEGMPAAPLLLPPIKPVAIVTENPEFEQIRVASSASGPVRTDSPPTPPPKSLRS